MANSDKNIVITPNINQAADPKIVFSGANTTLGAQNISLEVFPENNGTLSFSGTAGQLFSITNDLTGTIFSVNDVSGIPSIEVDADGTVSLAEFGGSVIVGNASPFQAKIITTGANTTAGNITGNWSLTAGSRLNATYADLAECYVADQDYEPGTVLMFAGEHEVSAVNEADSHTIAGVVSTNPAYVMNMGCKGEYVVQLALMGRVPCKVKGTVNKGDLMVSSEHAGFAKANNQARTGTVIGKALEAFDGSEPEGVIEILVGRC